MGKPTGFMEYAPKDRAYKPVEERVRDFREFVIPLSDQELSIQGARCMDCGIPFCHQGCPLGNLIPEWNDLVWRDDWRAAIERLHATNNFPEFTGRICPAPCEASCNGWRTSARGRWARCCSPTRACSAARWNSRTSSPARRCMTTPHGRLAGMCLPSGGGARYFASTADRCWSARSSCPVFLQGGQSGCRGKCESDRGLCAPRCSTNPTWRLCPDSVNMPC